MNKAGKQYLRAFKSCLPVKRTEKIAAIKKSIREWETDEPGADYESLKARLGDPQAVAEEYLADLSSLELTQALKQKKKIVAWVAGVMLAALLVWAGAVGYAVWNATASETEIVLSDPDMFYRTQANIKIR